MNHQEFINTNEALYKCAFNIGIDTEHIDRAYSINFNRAFNIINTNEPRLFVQIISDTARAYRKAFNDFALQENTIVASSYTELVDDLFMDMYSEELQKLQQSC
jgi:hypothetical protein